MNFSTVIFVPGIENPGTENWGNTVMLNLSTKYCILSESSEGACKLPASEDAAQFKSPTELGLYSYDPTSCLSAHRPKQRNT